MIKSGEGDKYSSDSWGAYLKKTHKWKPSTDASFGWPFASYRDTKRKRGSENVELIPRSVYSSIRDSS